MVSLLASVALWFLYDKESGLFVGIWVPSILAFWVGVKVSLLNFAITPIGLEDQLLGLIMVTELPELEKKKNELLVTHMSRQQQMRWKRERKAQEDVDDKHIADKMKGLNTQLREEEADKIRDNFDRAKARDGYLLKQMADKTARAEEEKEEEMYEAEQIKQWMGDDDAIFDQYAQMCLDEWVSQGKNPKPMELVLQKQRSTAGKLS